MRFVGAAAILVASLLASCSGGDSARAATSALEKQLVGHWSTRGDDNLYYGEADATSKIGSFIMVHPDGKSFTHRYKIESGDPSERTLKVNLLFATGDSREETLVISKDGKTIDATTTITGIEVQSQIAKVDENTAP